MKRDIAKLPKDFNSSFLSCEKDCENILKKLFVTSKPYSDDLKRLLVINTKDCLDNKDSQIYKDVLKDMTLSKLKDEGYIKLEPKISMPEHEEIKSYIIISFDNFMRTNNTSFRDCTISFDVLCHTDFWDLGNFRIRPLKIVGYIDGILNDSKLSGIGKLEFMSCKELLLDETLSGYTLIYRAVHGSDDLIPAKS